MTTSTLTCGQARDRLAAYGSSRIHASAAQQLFAHMMVCDSCHRELWSPFYENTIEGRDTLLSALEHDGASSALEHDGASSALEHDGASSALEHDGASSALEHDCARPAASWTWDGQEEALRPALRLAAADPGAVGRAYGILLTAEGAGLPMKALARDRGDVEARSGREALSIRLSSGLAYTRDRLELEQRIAAAVGRLFTRCPDFSVEVTLEVRWPDGKTFQEDAKVIGRSLELPIAIAVASRLLEMPVSGAVVFSGGVEADGRLATIGDGARKARALAEDMRLVLPVLNVQDVPAEARAGVAGCVSLEDALDSAGGGAASNQVGGMRVRLASSSSSEVRAVPFLSLGGWLGILPVAAENLGSVPESRRSEELHVLQQTMVRARALLGSNFTRWLDSAIVSLEDAFSRPPFAQASSAYSPGVSCVPHYLPYPLALELLRAFHAAAPELFPSVGEVEADIVPEGTSSFEKPADIAPEETSSFEKPADIVPEETSSFEKPADIVPEGISRFEKSADIAPEGTSSFEKSADDSELEPPPVVQATLAPMELVESASALESVPAISSSHSSALNTPGGGGALSEAGPTPLSGGAARPARSEPVPRPRLKLEGTLLPKVPLPQYLEGYHLELDETGRVGPELEEAGARIEVRRKVSGRHDGHEITLEALSPEVYVDGEVLQHGERFRLTGYHVMSCGPALYRFEAERGWSAAREGVREGGSSLGILFHDGSATALKGELRLGRDPARCGLALPNRKTLANLLWREDARSLKTLAIGGRHISKESCYLDGFEVGSEHALLARGPQGFSIRALRRFPLQLLQAEGLPAISILDRDGPQALRNGDRIRVGQQQFLVQLG